MHSRAQCSFTFDHLPLSPLHRIHGRSKAHHHILRRPMDVLEGFGIHHPGINITNSAHFLFCYKAATTTTSSGFFSGDTPFDYAIPILLLQIIIIFAASRLTHALLKHIGQPQVISHLIAGIILGPSFLSHNDAFKQLMFPVRSWVYLDIISLLSFMLFIFIIGVKTDLKVIRISGSNGIAISQAGAVFPFFLSALVSFWLIKNKLGLYNLIIQTSAQWAVTSNSVLACLLDEFNLLTSKLGRLALSASLIGDMQHLVIAMLVTSIAIGASLGSIGIGISTFFTFIIFSAFIVFLIRPMVIWMIRRTPKERTMDETLFMTVLLIALGCGLIGQLLGLNAILGPLMLGLVLRGGPPLGTTLADRLDRFLSGLFLPIYMTMAGLRTNLFEVKASPNWVVVSVLIGASTVAKLGAVVVVCVMYCKMLFWDAIVVGLMMNCRGIVELHTINAWHDNNIMDRHIYTVNIIFIVIVGGLSAALLKLIYNPSFRFTTDNHHHRCCTLHHTLPSAELRLMVCVHSPENVFPLLSLIQSTTSHSTRTPLCIYLLHLIPLSGHTTATLTRYKMKRRHPSALRSPCIAPDPSTYSSTPSDTIVNAFHSLEDGLDFLSVVPFVCRSPYVSMHDDVCTLSYEKHIVLILLPFHKYTINDVEYTNPNIQAMNVNVLRYAPCSVAILVSRCGSGPLDDEHDLRVSVVFFGGADDHEALAYGTRMADNAAIKLTVIRVLVSSKGLRLKKVKKDDERAMEGFKAIADGKRVVYREEVVKDGAGTVEVLKGVCSESRLVIVGRREGVELPATAGLEEWSEYKELGVVGDIMATADFGEKVSTLVVHQQGGGGKTREEDGNSRGMEGRAQLNEGSSDSGEEDSD